MWLRISRLGPESRTNLAFFNGFSKEFKADCARSPHKCRRFRVPVEEAGVLTSRCCNMRSTILPFGGSDRQVHLLAQSSLLPSLALAGRNLGLLWRNGGLLAGPSLSPSGTSVRMVSWRGWPSSATCSGGRGVCVDSG